MARAQATLLGGGGVVRRLDAWPDRPLRGYTHKQLKKHRPKIQISVRYVLYTAQEISKRKRKLQLRVVYTGTIIASPLLLDFTLLAFFIYLPPLGLLIDPENWYSYSSSEVFPEGIRSLLPVMV
jgi:hypothetical protein